MPNQRPKEFTCANLRCGRSFVGVRTREEGNYCSSRCRAVAWRDRRRGTGYSTLSLITHSLREAMGVPSEPLTHEVERGAIVRFADAIADPNPLYRDEAYARHSGYGGIIAPPTFLRTLQPGPPKIQWQSPLHNKLDGGSEWQYLEPLQAGDRITVVETLIDVKERTSRLGPMVILTRELTYTNQLSQLVATQRWTLITY